MRDIRAALRRWVNQNNDTEKIYAATLIFLESSAVRGVGATMALSPSGLIIGSVSGGCIEPALIRDMERLRAAGTAERRSFCPGDDSVFRASSPCGGTLEVLMYPLDEEVLSALERREEAGGAARWALVAGDTREGEKDSDVGVSCALDESGSLVASPRPDGSQPGRDLVRLLADVLTDEEEQEAGGGIVERGRWSLYIERAQAPFRFFIVGGSQIGEALCAVSSLLGWKTVLVDPREAFSQEWRFEAASLILHEWPAKAFDSLDLGPEDGVAAITHNEAMDDEAVAEALRRQCRYVGVLGGGHTQKERRRRLREMGFSEEALGKIHGPIGLSIAAKSPEEIALSIAAEAVQEYRK